MRFLIGFFLIFAFSLIHCSWSGHLHLVAKPTHHGKPHQFTRGKCGYLFTCLYHHLHKTHLTPAAERFTHTERGHAHHRGRKGRSGGSNAFEPQKTRLKKFAIRSCVCTGNYCTVYSKIGGTKREGQVDDLSLLNVAVVPREKRSAPNNACAWTPTEANRNIRISEACDELLELLRADSLNATRLPILGCDISNEDAIFEALEDLKNLFDNGPANFTDSQLEVQLHKLIGKLVQEIVFSIENDLPDREAEEIEESPDESMFAKIEVGNLNEESPCESAFCRLYNAAKSEKTLLTAE